jgi:hypothetical protein
MVKEDQGQHPGSRTILRISEIALIDWRALKQSDWDADDWGDEENQYLTSGNRSRQVYLQALQRRLGRVGVSSVEVVDSPYMEVVPVQHDD